MIKVLTHTKKGLNWGTLEDLDKKNSTVFVDCLNPSKGDLKKVSELTCVNIEDIRETLDPEERPRVTEYPNYTVIAFKTPLHMKRGEIETITIGLIILKYGIVVLRTHDIRAISQFEVLTKEQKENIFSKGPTFLFYQLLDHITDDYFAVMEDIEEKLDKIETKIFRGTKEDIMQEIFKLKKTLIFFHKSLTANREVMAMMDKDFVKELHPHHVRRFRKIYNDINELIDIESTYKDILTGQIEIYLSQVSNQLNVVMKKLTALASFVLIPTLISGIYGMNFDTMPELGWPFGYYMALGIMIFSVVSLYWYFKRKDWL